VPAEAASRRTYYGWVLVWALGISTIVSYGTTQYLFQVLVVPIQHDLGWSRAQISGAYSLTFVSAGLIGLVSGRIVDRRGARLLMALGSAVAGLALIALSQVHQLWQLYVLWSGCIAIANALTFYPTTFIVITNWFIRRRGSALALLTLLGGLASPIFIPLAGVLVPRLGWRETVVVFGLIQLLVALPIHLLAVRRRPEDMGLLPDGEPPGAEKPEPIRGAVMGEAVRGLPFWTLTISAALGLLAHAVLLTHPAYPSENQLLRAICQEFRIGKSAKAKLDLLNLFQAYLINEWRQGHRPVLIIDEAQTLKPPLLELLRQLLNFETNTEKLLQVVLFGQNELRDRLDRKPNLKSRGAMWGALTTLTREDTEAMLRFRYQVAGGGSLPLAPAALERVYRYARGVPRTTCIICDNALLKTFLAGAKVVVEAVVDTVYEEMSGPVVQPHETKIGLLRKQEQEVLHG